MKPETKRLLQAAEHTCRRIGNKLYRAGHDLAGGIAIDIAAGLASATVRDAPWVSGGPDPGYPEWLRAYLTDAGAPPYEVEAAVAAAERERTSHR